MVEKSLYLLLVLQSAAFILFVGCASTPKADKTSYASDAVECRIDQDSDGLMNCADPDVDGDGILNADDDDDDGDSCKDTEDSAPLNPASGCASKDDGKDDISQECKDDGEWVTVATESTEGEKNLDLSKCLRSKSFDAQVTIQVHWCADHKDALILNGSYLSLRSYAQGLGDMGGFPGVHSDCAGLGYGDLAKVFVVKEGEEPVMHEWKHPAFSAFSLSILNLDPASATRVESISRLGGRVNISYTNANNNFGAGQLTHIFRAHDTDGGADVYSLSFKYQFNVLKTGVYK